MALGAREEFRIYLFMYAKRLGAEGLKGKIEELLRSLLGDIFVDVREPDRELENSKEELCGWKREELLKEVVLILGKPPTQRLFRYKIANNLIGKHRDLQRITVPYARLLGVINERPDDQGMITDM